MSNPWFPHNAGICCAFMSNHIQSICCVFMSNAIARYKLPALKSHSSAPTARIRASLIYKLTIDVFSCRYYFWLIDQSLHRTMRYFGLIQPHYRPFLRGRGSLLNFEFKCHKFLPGVGTLNENELYLFKLIPGQFSDHTLHGPASLLNRTIVYPCDKFMCQIEYEDHKLHHRAIHLECIFCLQIKKIFPFYMFFDWSIYGSL